MARTRSSLDSIAVAASPQQKVGRGGWAGPCPEELALGRVSPQQKVGRSGWAGELAGDRSSHQVEKSNGRQPNLPAM